MKSIFLSGPSESARRSTRTDSKSQRRGLERKQQATGDSRVELKTLQQQLYKELGLLVEIFSSKTNTERQKDHQEVTR